MNKNVKLDLLQDETNAMIAHTVSVVPVVGGVVSSILEGVSAFRKNEGLKRLDKFLSAAEIDEDYINELKDNDESRILFLEYIESVISTPNPLVCVALALIFRDDDIGDSLKSLCARSLGGLSQGTVNVFFTIFDYARNDKSEELNCLIDKNKSFPIGLSRIGLSKDPKEICAFSSDLISRNFCASKDSAVGDGSGNNVTLNSYSFYVYKKLQDAQRYLDESQ